MSEFPASQSFLAVAQDFRHGKNFQYGIGCIIEPDVIVGDNVTIGHNVMLKSGTRIGNNVNLADRVHTTGVCLIGDNVMVRTGSCISKSVIVEDWVFIGAGIMSSHTRNVYHGRPDMDKEQLVTRIGYGAIVGSQTNLTAGIEIAPGSIVGYACNVTKPLMTPWGLYLGNPAEFVRSVKSTPWAIDVPRDWIPLQFDKELLAKYLPFYRGQQNG